MQEKDYFSMQLENGMKEMQTTMSAFQKELEDSKASLEEMQTTIGVLRKESEDSKASLSKLNSLIAGLQNRTSFEKSVIETVANNIMEEDELESKQAEVESFIESNGSEKSGLPSYKELIHSTIKAMEGETWNVVDFDDESNIHGFNCQIVPFRSSTGKGGESICVHPFNDIISNVIRSNGRWQDCDILSQFWNAEVVTRSGTDRQRRPVYVEVGANIGSCIMEMLLSTDALIVAFEPNPKNLFPLKETMRRLNRSYQERVIVLPVALGSTKNRNIISSASNNMGNSQVGTTVRDLDVGGQEFLENDKFEVMIERLDSILKPGTDIPLMKLDAQGYECEILKGMGHGLASSIRHVHFEKADLFLRAHDCNDLLPMFRDLGFEVYDGNGAIIQPYQDNQQMAYDLEARRKS